MSELNDTAQAAQQILERLKEAAPRLSRPARRELLKRLKLMNEELARAQAARQVDAFLERHTNGNMEDVRHAITNSIDVPDRHHQPDTGGERRPAGYLRGVPFYDSDDGAAWD